MDITQILYKPLYASFGVDAFVRCVYGDSFLLRAIDMTSGVEVSDNGNVDVKTIRPAAALLVSDLSEAGLERADLEDAALEMSGKIWRVTAVLPKPAPTGEADGELYLFLVEDNDE